MDQEYQVTKKNPQKSGYVLALVILVIMIAGAILVAMKWLGVNPIQSDQAAVDSSEGFQTEGIKVEVERSQVLPDEPYNQIGMFVSREDNSIFIGTGMIGMVMDDDGPKATYDGPLLEVVITNQTQLYRDETEEPVDMQDGDVLQQKVEQGWLVELVNGSQQVLVWGKKSGDRVIAEVVLYTLPWIPKVP